MDFRILPLKKISTKGYKVRFETTDDHRKRPQMSTDKKTWMSTEDIMTLELTKKSV